MNLETELARLQSENAHLHEKLEFLRTENCEQRMDLRLLFRDMRKAQGDAQFYFLIVLIYSAGLITAMTLH